MKKSIEWDFVKMFFESPYASDTILKPELSTAHLGIEERDLEIEKKYNCNLTLFIWLIQVM